MEDKDANVISDGAFHSSTNTNRSSVLSKAAISGVREREWINGWLQGHPDAALRNADVSHPMLDATISKIAGRRILVEDQWLFDFASCNYLGFDLDPEIQAAISPEVARWGTHPSWSRMLGSPILYEQIEKELATLLCAPDVLALPTITHIHTSVIPALAGDGLILIDARAHKTIYDACLIARGQGAEVLRFNHNNPEDLEAKLRASSRGPRIVCMDGVNSMTGNAPDLAAFTQLARRYDALLYIDDAHGFGLIGERSQAELCPWGGRGNGIVRYAGVGYENVVLVAGLSKAYSSLLAFLALPTRLKQALKIVAAPYLYSGPSPVASLATTLAGLRVNAQRGDQIRRELYGKCRRLLDGLAALDIRTLNTSSLPIAEVPLADADQADALGRYLFRRGVYVTLAIYPLVPRSEVGIRIQLTAANETSEIDHLLSVLNDARREFKFQQPAGVVASANRR